MKVGLYFDHSWTETLNDKQQEKHELTYLK